MNKKIEISTQFLLYTFLIYCALTVGNSWDQTFNMTRGSERLIRQVNDYSTPNVSDKIVRIIHSYTDYVNRVIWKKY